MKIKFITGNKNKFDEASLIYLDLIQEDIDLPETQSTDVKEVIQSKLKSASEFITDPFVVEDISFEIDGMNGLPGALIKWFVSSIGNEGLVKLADIFGSNVTVKACLGYKNKDEEHFFESIVTGKIVEPRGNGWGFDNIFLPDGSDKTYGEMSLEEKNNLGQRAKLWNKFKEFILN